MRPRSRAVVSAATINARPIPCRRARRCTSIFVRLARWGWFSGRSRINCTVPTMPSESSATSSARWPRATARADARQNACALARSSGSKKPTDAPPSTQSTRTAAMALMCVSVTAVRRRTEMARLGSCECISAPARSIARIPPGVAGGLRVGWWNITGGPGCPTSLTDAMRVCRVIRGRQPRAPTRPQLRDVGRAERVGNDAVVERAAVYQLPRQLGPVFGKHPEPVPD